MPRFPVLAILCGLASASAADLRFNRDIRPILSNSCFQCHGPDEKNREGGLRLDEKAGATMRLKSGKHAIVPGDPDKSELIARITTHDADDRMPPPKSKRPNITLHQLETLREWIRQGAPYEGHWAFQPLRREEPPSPADAAWAKNEIDHFILARLEAQGLKPSPEADRRTLLRRLFLDLTGLLPTPAETEAFVADAAPDAYEKQVEKLLASPHYGERWGRHWLDQARYADSDGYAPDGFRVMWPYRDWVIAAFNSDMPFDRFTIEQIAGDLLPNATKAQQIASAFHRNTLINTEGGSDPEQFRIEAVMDRVNTTGAVWLGLTIGCAQCHTHKFDPITQREFYQMFAFFNNGQDVNNRGATVTVGEGELFGKAPPKPSGDITDAMIEQLRQDWEKRRVEELQNLVQRNQAEEEMLETLLMDPAARGGKRKDALDAAFAKAHPETKKTPIRSDDPEATTVAQMVMKDLPKPRENYLFQRGDFLRPDKAAGIVPPGVLSAVSEAFGTPLPEFKNRLDLAHWLISPKNPLTPRVTMNRVWMRYFGRGLVETEEDFGTQGAPPSHPELLDWLATEFIQRGWSFKAMHRLIVTSATYRQASTARKDLAEKDPKNYLLGKQERLRVEAEIIRDAALCASGLLHPTIGGRGFRPPQPDGVYSFTQNAKRWEPSPAPERFRRGMYTVFFRSAAHPLYSTFDVPDMQTACTRRIRSNTPLQALSMANDAAMFEIAQGFAARLHREAQDLPSRIQLGFELTHCRPPSAKEAEIATTYHASQLAEFQRQPAAATAMVPEALRKENPAEAAALVCLARLLLNTDAFITRE